MVLPRYLPSDSGRVTGARDGTGDVSWLEFWGAYTCVLLNTYNHPMKKKVLTLDLRFSSGVVTISQVTFADVWLRLYCHSWEKGWCMQRPGSVVSRPLCKLFFLVAATKHLAEAAEGRAYIGLWLEATVHQGREIMVAGASGCWSHCICSQKVREMRAEAHPAHALGAPTFKMNGLRSTSLV